MTEYIANMLTKNMYMDGLIKESEESIYSYSIQLIVEKITLICDGEDEQGALRELVAYVESGLGE